MELTQERLKELLHYDPETGVFTRVKDLSGGAKVGDVAGTALNTGYRRIRVDGAQHQAHRLAWLYVHGEFPVGLLDHRDQDKSNNCIPNLRPATKSQNKMNVGPQANNTSGHKGVCWHKRIQKWVAYIKIDQKKQCLGYFADLLDAVAARKAAEESLGISEFCPQ